jgi:hypothetical protein
LRIPKKSSETDQFHLNENEEIIELINKEIDQVMQEIRKTSNNWNLVSIRERFNIDEIVNQYKKRMKQIMGKNPGNAPKVLLPNLPMWLSK